MPSDDDIISLVKINNFEKFSSSYEAKDISKLIEKGFGAFFFNGSEISIGFKRNLSKKIIIVSKEEFVNLISSTVRDDLVNFCLKRREENFLISVNKPFKRASFILIVFSAVILLTIYSELTRLFFLRMVSFYVLCRFLFLIYGIFHDEEEPKPRIKKLKQPVYSIIIALYKEKDLVRQLLDSISKINYPKDKLDVIFAIEDDDEITKLEFSKIDLPNYVTVIKVPYFQPRTKPKALNYAINFSRGKYIAIYDAEDLIDPEQINISLEKFDSDPKFGALQGILLFYNFKQNILTRLFYFEYWTWFQFTMYAIAQTLSYIPLGGSTNHFKREALFDIGCWDSFNVTEDLEISLRLFNNGHRLGLINSVTQEQCVYNMKSWLKQRIRWQKGYFITYITYFLDSFRNFEIVYFLIFHFIVGFSWLVFLITPILFFYFDIISSLLYILYVTVLCSIIMFLNLKFSLLKLFDMVRVVLCYPIYFIMHSVASYLMIFDTIIRPSYWAKTNHDKKEALYNLKQ